MINRSSRPEVFCKKGVIRNFSKSTGKHLCQSLLFNKVAGLPMLESLFKNTFFTEYLWWLLLDQDISTFSHQKLYKLLNKNPVLAAKKSGIEIEILF